MRAQPLPMTADDHVELGNQLKDANDAISSLLPRFPASTKVSRDAVRVLDALDRLRDSLDTVLCRQVPLARDPRNLATWIYCGNDRFGLRWYDFDELERDAFALWRPVSGTRAEQEARAALAADNR